MQLAILFRQREEAVWAVQGDISLAHLQFQGSACYDQATAQQWTVPQIPLISLVEQFICKYLAGQEVGQKVHRARLGFT